LLGRASSPDLGIAQRSFEAARVFDLLGISWWAPLTGLGPGATVDLRGSPAGATLVVAGRDLSAVPDVHFLTAHLLLKTGVLGFVWLLILVIALWRSFQSCLGASDQLTTFRLGLVLFVTAGIANSLT